MGIRRTLFDWRDALAARRLQRRIRSGAWRMGEGAPHGLPGELIVSLTSYPPRFGTLDLTISSLLAQSIRPDRVILWLAEADEAVLPSRVRSLEAHGLTVRTCEDLRSYKKLVPTLQAYPDAFIVTSDDDVYYPGDWLATLVQAFDPAERIVVGRRAHRFACLPDGRIQPYLDWRFDVTDDRAKTASTDLVPIGIGGILYPPGTFDTVALDRALFERICPDGDDLWFWWMARMGCSRHRQAGPRFRQIAWPSTQDDALWYRNVFGGNDRKIEALQEHFGLIGCPQGDRT